MPTPEMSDITTQGVRVGATAFYLADQSDPDENKYLFGYNIVVSNDGSAPAQLISRHWVIIAGEGRREEVTGPGVVGQTPRLEPGQAFKYQSFCPLRTPWGTMEGTYQMRRDDGEMFDAKIGRFFLSMPGGNDETRTPPARRAARPKPKS